MVDRTLHARPCVGTGRLWELDRQFPPAQHSVCVETLAGGANMHKTVRIHDTSLEKHNKEVERKLS